MRPAALDRPDLSGPDLAGSDEQRASSPLTVLTSQAHGRTTRQIDGIESLHIALENASAAPRVLLVLMRKGLDDGRVRPCRPHA